MTRRESDPLGEMELPDEVNYGIQTARALSNFPVSGLKAHDEFIRAYLFLKSAAARTNMELGLLDEERGHAIVLAVGEALRGSMEEFVVDVFQAGAGTSFHMNVNEVLANRALLILGRKKGDYSYLSPNDHVNMAQSTNDTFPTAAHMAVIKVGDQLLNNLTKLAKALEKKGEEFKGIPKTARTHLTDAVPITLGAEFRGYGAAVRRAIGRIKRCRDDLLELPIGGTAAGTGANAHPEFRRRMIKNLSQTCGLPFREAENSYEALQSRSQLAAFSSSLRELAQELTRIANDLRLLGSGPTSGINEIILPYVQPGSSIMPGKVNPVMAECLNMICFEIIGYDCATSLAAQAGQMDLNVFTPLISHNILESMRLLNNYLPVFTRRYISGIKANQKKCRETLKKNPSLATLLAPKIGYMKAAEVAERAVEKNISVFHAAVEMGVLSRKEAEKLLSDEAVERAARGLYG